MSQQYFSRDQWRDRGRYVAVPNEEAKDVVNLYLPNRFGVAGARHVFSEDQTLPLEQLEQMGVAA